MSHIHQGSSALKCKVMLNKVISHIRVDQDQLNALRQKKYENLGNLLNGNTNKKIEILSTKDIDLGIGIPFYELTIESQTIPSTIPEISSKKNSPETNNEKIIPPKKTTPKKPKPKAVSTSEVTSAAPIEYTRVANPFAQQTQQVHDQNDIHAQFIPMPVSQKTFSIFQKLLSPQIKNFWNGLKPAYRNFIFAGGSVGVAQASFLIPGLYENEKLNLHFKNEYLAYWALITGGRLLLNEISSKESSPKYWTIHSLQHVQWEKFSRHFGFSFMSLPLLQSVLYGVLSSTQHLTNSTLKQSIIFTSMALANGSWLYFTYGTLNESDKVRRHNFFRSMWGSGLGLSIALSLEAATQVPELAKTIPAIIPMAHTLVQNSLILNKISSDFVAYVIHSRDPVHQMKLKAFSKIYQKTLKRYESPDKDLHRQATFDVLRIWIKEAYGKPGLEYFFLAHHDLETLEKNHQLIREMLDIFAPDKVSRQKLKRSLYKVQTDHSVTLTPKLVKFIENHPGLFKYHEKTKKLGYFKQKEKPSPELIKELQSCAKDSLEKLELEKLLTINLLDSVRKPYAIIENLEPYFNDFDEWLVKMDLKIQRKIRLKKLKYKYTHHFTEALHRYVPEKTRLQIKKLVPKLMGLPLIEYSYHVVQKQIDSLIVNHMQLTTYIVGLQKWFPSMTADKQIDYASLAAAGFSYSTARMLYQSLKGQNTEFLKDFGHWIAGLSALFWIPNSFNIFTIGLILILRPFEILRKIFNRYYKRV